MSSVKKSRKSGRTNVEDRISNLPERVISHILSCLPTEDAVRTSVLSKDWEFKWTSIYHINIDGTWVLPRSTTFVNYVERILLFSQNVRSFHLKCLENYGLSRITAWISAVLMRNVECLEVIYPTAVGLLLPRNLLNSTSLRRLKLEIPCTFKVPSNNCFPNLSSLYLYEVEIRNELSNTETLVFTFPVLETLELKRCKWLDVKFVEINAPALTKFTSETPFNAQVDDYSLKVLGGKLTDFESSGSLPENLNISTGSSVVHVAFNNLDNSLELVILKDSESKLKKIGLQVRRLLNGFQNLEDLKLSAWIMEAMAQSKRGLALPIFQRLQRLTIKVQFCITELLELLHAAAFLKSLVVDNCFLTYHNFEAVPLPSCILSTLEDVELIYNCRPELYEFDLVEFLLKNGLRLKKFHIHGIHDDKKKEFVKLLSTFPKGSTCLTITVT